MNFSQVTMYDVWEHQYKTHDTHQCEDCENATYIPFGPDDAGGYECNLNHDAPADGCPYYVDNMEKEEDYELRDEAQQGKDQLNS